MKRIIVFLLLCTMLMVAMPVVAFATDEPADTVEVTETVPEAEAEPTVTDDIVEYVKSHVEEIIVIAFMCVYGVVESKMKKKQNGFIGTLNNNAIAVAENSAAAIKKALEEAQDVANVVKEYKEEFASLLAEVRKSAEEKQSLEEILTHVETFLKTAKLATLELSNEVAELLVLANIPNSKKEELYARHTKAVHELEAVEEVKSDDNAKT